MKPPSCVGNQPSATELKRLGIKVRDFALEKTLQPAHTVYIHRQILPASLMQITHQNTEGVLQLQQSYSASRSLDRKPTEPSLSPAPPKSADGMSIQNSKYC